MIAGQALDLEEPWIDTTHPKWGYAMLYMHAVLFY